MSKQAIPHKTHKKLTTGQIRPNKGITFKGLEIKRIEDCPFVENCSACCPLVDHWCAPDDPKCKLKK
jgi:hypothetical protein